MLGGTLFVRPTVTFDYIRLKEDGYTDSGGGAGLDLTVDDRTSDELGLNAGVALGIDFIGNRRYDRNWFRIETEGGWRQIVGGELGATTAHFAGGSDFTLTPDQTANGWYAKLRAMGGTDHLSFGKYSRPTLACVIFSFSSLFSALAAKSRYRGD